MPLSKSIMKTGIHIQTWNNRNSNWPKWSVWREEIRYAGRTSKPRPSERGLRSKRICY